MKKEIDLRGLTCPEPVLRAKKLIDDQSISVIEALVDSEVNVQNLSRLAHSQKRSLSCAKSENHFLVIISRPDSPQSRESTQTSAHNHDQVQTQVQTQGQNQVQTQNKSQAQPVATGSRGGGLVIFINRDTFGQGASDADHDFSNNLLNVFLQTIEQSGHKPAAILLANSGVKLMDPDGAHNKVLQDLKAGGSTVLGCGLCLDYYKLKEKVPTEQITNMFAICEYLLAADQVLTP